MPDLTSPETVDSILRATSWAVIAFAALWFVTGLIGYFHRRAYNLTRAESSPSKNVKPDFLSVDEAKRQAAIKRGEAFDKVLEAREAAVSPAVVTAASWSRWLATSAALVSSFVFILGALTRIDDTEAMAREVGNLTRLWEIIQAHPVGAAITLAVIAANIVVFYLQHMKKR